MDLNNLLICTDLDRTLLPNGVQAESPTARALFQSLVDRPEVKLAYVSGRDQQLLKDAIREYDIPFPDFAIADVGTSIYSIQGDHWQLWQSWHDEIAMDWGNHNQSSLAEVLQDLKLLRLQEQNKQGKYKLSYYGDENLDTGSLLRELETRFHMQGIKASFIWSIDETSHTGLLDILPKSANKLHAINFLIRELAYPVQQTVFAGDSGNDLEVLCSDIPAILVANATAAVKEQAYTQAAQNGNQDWLYQARGGFLGMNGNYAAGIIEGIAHYHPLITQWLD